MTAEITRLAKEGPTVAELDRAKTKQESEFISGLERIGGFEGKSDVLNRYNTFLGTPDRMAADLQRYRALTPASVQQAVARWIDTPNRVLIRFHPEQSARPTDTTTLDRSVVPPLGADRPFTAPTVQTAKLPNGMDVLVVERHDLPKATVTLVTRAGSIADPAGKPGVANLTMTTIDLGTRTRKALEIEDALGALGTTLGGGAGRETAAINFEVLSRNLPAALDIVADIAQNPTFPEEEVSRERKRLIDALTQAERSGNALAARIQPMLAFGADHPYGRPVQGLKSSAEKITRDDLVAFHQARWRARIDRARHRRRCHAGTSDGTGDEGIRRVDRWSGRRDQRPGACPIVSRTDLPRRSARLGADGGCQLPARTAAQLARLRCAVAGGRGLGRWRLWYAVEPESPREARLLVRRVLEFQSDADRG